MHTRACYYTAGAAESHEAAATNITAVPALHGVSVAFKALSYYVPGPSGTKGDELQLLHNITGSFRPGVLTALMGSSGESE